MGALDSLSPGQRQMVMLGVPVVAVFALVSGIQKKSAATASAPAVPTGYTLPTMASTDAIGTSQLSEFEDMLSGNINNLSNQVSGLTAQVSSIPTAAPPPPTPTLARVNSGDYPVIAAPGTAFDVLGTVTNGTFSGVNVSGGAPVYANINGQWQQDYNLAALPAGTPLATPTTFHNYEVTG